MKIIAIGRNYIEHAKELNNPVPQQPVFFLKPETSIIRNNQPFYHPDFSTDIHYEAEIVLKICKVGKNIANEFAHRYYEEIGIGIDLTARDLQAKAKQKGLPWEIAKAFDGSAPLGHFFPKTDFPDMKNIQFQLKKNNQLVQDGTTADMIFDFDTIIAYVSQYITLKIGDLIFTGTPAGVGPIAIGDHFEAFIENKKALELAIK